MDLKKKEAELASQIFPKEISLLQKKYENNLNHNINDFFKKNMFYQ